MTRHARVLEYFLLASTCLTVAYGGAAFNGLIVYDRLVMFLLLLPLLIMAAYKVAVKLMGGLLWLAFQLGYADTPE